MVEGGDFDDHIVDEVKSAVKSYIDKAMQNNPRIKNVWGRLLNVNMASKNRRTLDTLLVPTYDFDPQTNKISIKLNCEGSPDQYGNVSSLMDLCSSLMSTYANRYYTNVNMVLENNLDRVGETKTKRIIANHHSALKDNELFSVEYRQNRSSYSAEITITLAHEVAEITELTQDIFGAVWGNISMNESRLFPSTSIVKYSNPNKKGLEKKLMDCGIEVFKAADIRFAGYGALKEQIKRDVILPATHPEWYEKMREKTREVPSKASPAFILFYGPYGTGKTLMAKKIASEEGINFLSIKTNSIFYSFYMNAPLNRVEAIFDAAEEYSAVNGKTILFMDEIDALSKRASGDDQAVSVENRRVINAFLTRLDGLNSSSKNLILIGATNLHKRNKGEDKSKNDSALDGALLSRVTNEVYFPLPEYADRIEIFSLYAKNLTRNSLEYLADITNGFSGRAINDVVQEAENMKILEMREQLENGAEPEAPGMDHYKMAVESISAKINSKEPETYYVDNKKKAPPGYS